MCSRRKTHGGSTGSWHPPVWFLVILVAAGCATAPGQTKGGALEPFAEAGVTEEAAEGDRYALVIGIDEFEDESFEDLKYAVDDAKAVEKGLSDFDRVLRRTSPEQTDRADLLEAVDELGRLADDPRDVAFVYVSTHGTLDREPGGALERYLVARDTRLDVAASTGISVEKLASRLEQFGSERTALVLATCHSGSGKSAVSDELSEALARRKSGDPAPLRRVSEATIVLSAAAFEEPAREEDALQHDIYTYFFLEALESGDRDGNGAVTVSEAHDYARRRTYGYTEGQQRPTAWSSILGRDPIILSGTPDDAGKPVVYSYERSAEGVSVSVDGNEKGTLPGGIALNPGAHRVELANTQSGETMWRGRVRLAEGDRVEVSDLIPPPSTWELRLEGGGFGAIAAATRAEYLPVSGMLGLRAALVREPWSHALFELRATGFRSRGTATAFDTELPFELRGGHLQLGAGAVWRLGTAFDLEVGGDLGFFWASRSFDTSNYESDQQIRAPSLAGFAALNWRFLDYARLTLRADSGVLRAAIGGDPAFHPYGTSTLGFGVGF